MLKIERSPSEVGHHANDNGRGDVPSSRPALGAGLRRNPALLEAMAVIAMTAIASLLRLVALGSSPPGFQGDEAWLGLEAQRILDEGWIGVWTPVAWGQPAGIFYWTALFLQVLPDTVTAVRASIAVLGATTIPVFYLFAKSLFGVRPALIGTALLTVSYWHIHYSRTAYPLTAVPLFECATLFFLAKGLRERRGWPFVVAGVLAGAGVHTYRAYVFFGVLLGLLWLVLLLKGRFTKSRDGVAGPPTLLRHALLFAAPAVLVAAPLLLFVAINFDDYIGYGRISSVFGSEWLKDVDQEYHPALLALYKLARAIGIYYVGRQADPTDGLGTTGLLDPVTALLFTVGLVWCARRWRDWRHLTVLGGVAVGVASVAVTVEWGENRRAVVALPMVFAAAGLGADALIGTAIATWRPRERARPALFRVVRAAARRCVAPLMAGRFQRGARATVAAAVVAFVAWWNVDGYFGGIAQDEQTQFAYAYDLREAAEFIASQDGEPYVYFYSNRWRWEYEARRFLAPGVDGENRSDKFGEFSLDREVDDRPVVFLLMPPYDRHLDELKKRYPDGEAMVRREAEDVLFAAYVVGQGRGLARR